jgi:Flp pilus assembly pilin Flp
MAQMAENGLFRRVLRRCNASSIAASWGFGAGNGCKCCFHCRQIEPAEFSQSWIAVWHSSRTGNVRYSLGRTRVLKLKCLLADFAADESGATAIEYGLIAAGIALAIIEIIYALGTNLVAKLQALATALK